MHKFSKVSLKRLTNVHPDLIKIATESLKISEFDFGIPEYGGKRDEIEQHRLFIKGKSKADGKFKKSHHQTGRALDIYAYVNGKASWDSFYLSRIACAFFQSAIYLNVGIEWGGLWKNFVDMPHFQLTLSKND